MCVNNLPKVVTQLLPRVGFEPTTYWSQVQRSTRCTTYSEVASYKIANGISGAKGIHVVCPFYNNHYNAMPGLKFTTNIES